MSDDALSPTNYSRYKIQLIDFIRQNGVYTQALMLGKPLDEHDKRFLALDNAIRTAANNIRAREEKK